MPKRYSKRRVSKRRSKSTAATASKALAIAKKTQRRVELKFFEQLLNTTTIPDNGTIPVVLAAPPQGDGIGNREGNSVFVTSIDIRGAFKMIPTEIIRMVIYTWASGTSATSTDIFQNTGDALSAFSHKTLNTRFRSNILLDKTFCPRGFSGGTIVEVPFHYRLKGMNHRVTMTSGGVGAENGMIYIVFISNKDINDTLPSVTFRSRTVFKDL